jgi:uncharacterized membrane protein YkvI
LIVEELTRDVLLRAGKLHSRAYFCKVADVFITLALLLIAFVAFAMGFEPQFNGPVANTAVVFLFLGVTADGALHRFRRR